MHESTLFLAAYRYGVPEEDANDPGTAARALARVWSEQRLTIDEIRAQTKFSRHQIEEILELADRKIQQVSVVAREMAGVA